MPNSKDYTPATVKIGGQDAPPGRYTVQTVTRSLGGAKVDQATILVERAPDLYLTDGSARPLEIGQTCEVFLGDTRIFWGLVEDASFSFGDSPDSKTIVASVQPWVFGPPITHATYLVVRKRNYLGDATERIKCDDQIVFNGFASERREWMTRGSVPFVGNKTVDAQWLGLTRDGKNTAGRTALLIPLESVQTHVGREKYRSAFSPIARINAGGEPPKKKPDSSFEWTLRDAVRYVCVHGNNERYIRNPKNYDFLPEIVLPRTELPVGRYLPEYLDALLKPYGYDWTLDLAVPSGGGGTSGAAAVAGLIAGGQAAIGGLVAGGRFAISGLTSSVGGGGNQAAGGAAADAPRISFVQWGTGPAVSAKYATIGAKADFSTTNVANVDVAYSTSQTINEIHVKGGTVLIEGTFELKRVGLDKWVLNEGGDYLTSAYAQHHTSADRQFPIDANTVSVPTPDELAPKAEFGAFGTSGAVRVVQRPRRFLPTITTVGPTGAGEDVLDTRPIGPNGGYDIEVIELGQEKKAEGAEVWLPLADVDDGLARHVRVLEDECGIIFDKGKDNESETESEKALSLFLEAGGRLRITASIEMDFAVQAIVARDRPKGAFSASPDTHTWVMRDEHRWPCRMRMKSGRYATKYADHDYSNETPTPDQIVAEMRRTAREMLDRMDGARINGTVIFNNLDEAVPLGGVIKSIEGRDFHFPTRHSKDNPQFPQIVAVHYDVQSAVIVATLSAEPENAFEAFG